MSVTKSSSNFLLPDPTSPSHNIYSLVIKKKDEQINELIDRLVELESSRENDNKVLELTRNDLTEQLNKCLVEKRTLLQECSILQNQVIEQTQQNDSLIHNLQCELKKTTDSLMEQTKAVTNLRFTLNTKTTHINTLEEKIKELEKSNENWCEKYNDLYNRCDYLESSLVFAEEQKTLLRDKYINISVLYSDSQKQNKNDIELLKEKTLECIKESSDIRLKYSQLKNTSRIEIEAMCKNDIYDHLFRLHLYYRNLFKLKHKEFEDKCSNIIKEIHYELGRI